MARLERSLGELKIPQPMTRPALAHVMRETLRRNRVRNGTIYLQVTRGQAPRDFNVPDPVPAPTLVCLARQASPQRMENLAQAGSNIISQADIRWGRCDIKTVMLLPAVLAKEAARSQGAREAWLIGEDGFVTEGASSNAWIVTRAGEIVTRKADAAILPGITRRTLLDLIEKEGLRFVERPFTISEAYEAAEAFITSASATVMPVVRIDGRPIGEGRPGPIARALRAIFHQFAQLSET